MLTSFYEQAEEMICHTGDRVTSARVRVLGILLAEKQAISHHEIVERIGKKNSLDRVTLYRTLEWLDKKGLAHKVISGDRKWRFRTNIYTGSVGWYNGNSYWSFRTYVTPGEPRASKSGTLNYRKYRKDANNYFSINVGAGFSPEENRFNFGGNANTIINLQSQKFNIGYYFSSKNNKNYWGIQSGISHQEISFNPGSYFWIYSFSLSWGIKFR